jgi:hypothetical protein
MKYFFSFVPPLLAIFAGCILLLAVLSAATVRNLRYEGMAYWNAVAGTMVSPEARWVTFGSLAAVLFGLSGILRAVFLTERDARERKEALPVFWAALGTTALGMLALLFWVNSRDL